MRPVTFAAIILIFGSVSSVRAADPATASKAEWFETKIRPLLAARCFSCHGAEKVKGGLRLDNATDFREGGDSGPVVVAGKPDESSLITAVRYHGDLKMPPKGKLTDPEIATLTEWVRKGAEWPDLAVTKPKSAATATAGPANADAKKFWAFQPVREPALPGNKTNGWATSPIDRFILSGLEAKGLSPAPQANRRDLIRRATFDLIGLPPTVAEIEAFENDKSADAFAKVVDRLLASPRYGERWGRHWLDLARYADSNGMDENVAHEHAYRYRDYVIGAFNADRPYDEFLTEQIAGDLMPASKDESVNSRRLTATGFLVIGPKMLAEDDPVKMEMDIIDEQVDTVGRVFMGLTLGCARCHDHKFDPLPTADYYGLAGIFKSTKAMQNYKVVAMWNERPLGTKAENEALAAHKEKVKTQDEAIKRFVTSETKAVVKDARERLADYMLAGWKLSQTQGVSKREPFIKNNPPGAIVREAEAFDRGNVLIDKSTYGTSIGVILNKGELPNFAEYDLQVPTAGIYQLEIRLAAAASRPVRLILNGVQSGSEVAGEMTGTWYPDSQTWVFAGLHTLAAGKLTVRLESDGPFPHFDKFGFAPLPVPAGVDPEWLKPVNVLAKERKLNPRLMELWRDEFVKAKMDPKSIYAIWFDRERVASEWKASLLHEPAPKSAEDLAKRFAELAKEAAEATPAKKASTPFLAALDRAMTGQGNPFSLNRREEKFLNPESRAELKKRREALAALEKAAPPVSEVMSVEERQIQDIKICIRGNHTTLGTLVPRHFPVVLGIATQPLPGSGQSGRLELANWLANPAHPLTARVMANRIWQGHFGEGLVRSPDNFGMLGERPDNPELLDWLSRRFIDAKWSIKAMHRLIMLSSTYQMSTKFDAHANEADPDDRLLWRMPRRRLEAEAVRDALFAVSGDLDTTMGGSLLSAKNHAYVNSTVMNATLPFESPRRAVYLPIIRSGLYDVFQAFDFADPSASNGKRIPTTVAPQALFMLNDRVVIRASESIARRLLATPADEAKRVESAYLTILGRKPSADEARRAREYIVKFDRELATLNTPANERAQKAWQTFAQALLSSSEFLYLD